MDLITPGLGLVFWSLITFFILLVVLKKFAWKPILGAVDERESGIKNALEAADKARKEMENLKADNERILNEARAEREAMLKDARDIKNKMVSDAKEEAQLQATKMIAQAQEAIENEKRVAMAELKNHVATLSIEIAEKVVRQELGSKDKQLELVESMLGDARLN
ncbi:F0F1 ATP synthase subunit B [Gelidibacter salicanalis]|uniref:ATP synthase subunit b n=1 Tax=Gelidibacter salicanalis TaxID=291193 RepID=A0A934KIM8_9FLAO|nr:F0F1 ATP synthase subunit B [Gelidibacter salicanalis]MBJ7879697.1 F0F1 ATP synthase subunit B [Gelidibacter salicanalis]